MPGDELTELALTIADGLEPYDAVLALVGRVRDEVAYRAGFTGVSTDAAQAWQQRAGVCQDIAHVSLAVLRAAGVPARYVSGYLHPGGDAAPVGETVRGASHAWIEAWLGEWWGYDPTNAVPAGERHVVVARGRDYADVPPLKASTPAAARSRSASSSRSPDSADRAGRARPRGTPALPCVGRPRRGQGYGVSTPSPFRAA